MKLITITAIRAELNQEGQNLINSFKGYNSEEDLDEGTGFTKEQMENLGLPFKSSNNSSERFEVTDSGQLILHDNHFDYIKYKLEFPSFSHIEREDDGYTLITLDGSRHVISKKTYKKLKKGNPKTK